VGRQQQNSGRRRWYGYVSILYNSPSTSAKQLQLKPLHAYGHNSGTESSSPVAYKSYPGIRLSLHIALLYAVISQ